MNQALYDQVHAVFIEACGLVPAELGPFLDQACAGQPEVRAQVEELLGFISEDEPFEQGPPPEDPYRLLGVVLDERYRVDAFVASGGFSHVYRGWHLAWRLPVAIKLFKRPQEAILESSPSLAGLTRVECPNPNMGAKVPPTAPGSVADALTERFNREGALLAQLSKKSNTIIQAFDLGTWTTPRGEAITFMVMEWLEGVTLAALAQGDRRRWPLAEVLDLLQPIADALALAHRSGVAHRDIKPENIFVIGEEGARTTKLLDFGVAKVAALHSQGFESTSAARAPFTVGYAAPEQASRKFGATSPRTDVYALALVCVELLSGRKPYEEGSTRQVLAQAVDARRRPTPRALGVEVHKAVEAVFEAALSIQPSARPEDTAALWRALRAAAKPRGFRWWRRR